MRLLLCLLLAASVAAGCTSPEFDRLQHPDKVEAYELYVWGADGECWLIYGDQKYTTFYHMKKEACIGTIAQDR